MSGRCAWNWTSPHVCLPVILCAPGCKSFTLLKAHAQANALKRTYLAHPELETFESALRPCQLVLEVSFSSICA